MIHCTITSPQKTTVYDDLASITLFSYSGEMQILPGHAEYFGVLRGGNVTMKQQHGRKNTVVIKNGECHVKNDAVTIML